MHNRCTAVPTACAGWADRPPFARQVLACAALAHHGPSPGPLSGRAASPTACASRVPLPCGRCLWDDWETAFLRKAQSLDSIRTSDADGACAPPPQVWSQTGPAMQHGLSALLAVLGRHRSLTHTSHRPACAHIAPGHLLLMQARASCSQLTVADRKARHRRAFRASPAALPSGGHGQRFGRF